MISGGYISYGTETYKVFPTSTVFSLNPHFNLTLASLERNIVGIAPSLAKQEGWSFEVFQSRYIRQPLGAAILQKYIERCTKIEK